MLWQVRAKLDDRPGAMAVLHTPGGWAAPDVEQLCVLAGVDDPVVSACSAQALEDQPVRYVRAAQVVMERPELLEEQLCKLLDAFPADALPGLETLALDDEYGPLVELSRGVPFTDTELARASELRRLAASALGTDPDPALLPSRPAAMDSGEVTLRPGTAQDANALVALHARCSEQTVYRRYHAPVSHVSPRLARGLLQPAGGLSIVMEVGGDIVGIGVLAPDTSDVELGIMVEDRWQRHGYGARLLRALAVEAADRGVETLTCMVQPDNDAVLRTIHRAGLRARASFADGVTRYRIPVGRAQRRGVSSSGRSSAWSTTSDVTARVRQT